MIILGVVQLTAGFTLRRQDLRPHHRDHRREPRRDLRAALDRRRLPVVVARDLRLVHLHRARHLRPGRGRTSAHDLSAETRCAPEQWPLAHTAMPSFGHRCPNQWRSSQTAGLPGKTRWPRGLPRKPCPSEQSTLLGRHVADVLVALHTREVAGSKPAAPILRKPCRCGAFVVSGCTSTAVRGVAEGPLVPDGAQPPPSLLELVVRGLARHTAHAGRSSGGWLLRSLLGLARHGRAADPVAERRRAGARASSRRVGQETISRHLRQAVGRAGPPGRDGDPAEAEPREDTDPPTTLSGRSSRGTRTMEPSEARGADERLEERVMQLEAVVESLQDSVDRASRRFDALIDALQRKTSRPRSRKHSARTPEGEGCDRDRRWWRALGGGASARARCCSASGGHGGCIAARPLCGGRLLGGGRRDPRRGARHVRALRRAVPPASTWIAWNHLRLGSRGDRRGAGTRSRPCPPCRRDAALVTRSEATLDAIAELDQLLQRISADIVDPDWAPAPVDLDELRDLLDQQWKAWRRRHGRRARPGPAAVTGSNRRKCRRVWPMVRRTRTYLYRV